MMADERIIAHKGSYFIPAHLVRIGDLLDLEGDSIADPNLNGLSESGDFDFTFEYAIVEGVECVECETENCVRIDTDQGSYGFPVGHLIETTLDDKHGIKFP